jgi:hypothetical protein
MKGLAVNDDQGGGATHADFLLLGGGLASATVLSEPPLPPPLALFGRLDFSRLRRPLIVPPGGAKQTGNATGQLDLF